mgnify:CR=1 FL=1
MKNSGFVWFNTLVFQTNDGTQLWAAVDNQGVTKMLGSTNPSRICNALKADVNDPKQEVRQLANDLLKAIDVLDIQYID